MKKFSKIIISAVMITALSVTMLFTVAEMGIVIGNEPVVLTALGSGGDAPYVPPAPSKKSNPITVSGKTVKISYNKLKKKSQTISRKKAISVNNAQGSVTYKKKSSSSSKISVTSSGKIKPKKGLKAGTYTINVYVIASGNSRYYKRTRVAAVKIKVLTVENPIEVEGKSVTIKGDSLAAGKKVLSRKSVMSVSHARGTVTYEKKSGNKNITVNKKTGAITVKSALAGDTKKTYTVKVKVTAAGTKNYKKGSETATVKITITPVTPPDPVDPVDPDDPTDPVDPVNPDDPTDPVDPVNPDNTMSWE
jgi:hypothetical protein